MTDSSLFILCRTVISLLLCLTTVQQQVCQKVISLHSAAEFSFYTMPNSRQFTIMPDNCPATSVPESYLFSLCRIVLFVLCAWQLSVYYNAVQLSGNKWAGKLFFFIVPESSLYTLGLTVISLLWRRTSVRQLICRKVLFLRFAGLTNFLGEVVEVRLSLPIFLDILSATKRPQNSLAYMWKGNRLPSLVSVSWFVNFHLICMICFHDGKRCAAKRL